MIVRARMVVTMDGPPIENGAVAISGGKIIEAGRFSEVSAQHSDEDILDLGEQALLPGFINAHCHLDYTCLRGKIPPPKSFADWIRAINAEKTKLSPNDYVKSINDGFIEAQEFGTTTIANLTAFPELIGQINEPIRTWWFAELIDVRQPAQRHAPLTALSSQTHGTQDMFARAIGLLKSATNWGLAPHAPFTASANLYRECEEFAQREKILLTTHLAESAEEMSMFRDADGPLYAFLKSIGRDMSDCGRNTPLRRFFDIVKDSSASRLRPATSRQAVGLTDDWIITHLNELAEKDFDLLERLATKFSIVHCPRSHDYFAHSRFRFEKLRALGFNICLGTDSLASNDDLSLFAEMRAFQKEFPNVATDEILKMVTTNAASALGQESAIGKIAAGSGADLIALPCSDSGKVFEEIIAFNRPVNWVMVRGVIQ